jgi:conjugative relaxase-like TrwC/TraI family protein
MIRINVIPNAQAAKAYYGLSDYLIEGQEQEAQWHGKGAELLGLRGKVDQNVFDVLCDNINPNNGKQLTAKHLENRRVGYDFTFSVPKSVSLLYSLGQDSRIPDEFRGAVADTMAEMEREMSTRVRRKNADFDRTTSNMIWTDFLHHTSRPINGTPDPQLHIHAVVFNATYDREEGQWKAGQFGGLKADAPYFQAMFRTRLANRMQSLGYEIRKTKDDFEVTGVPERTLKEFSRRTSLIEKLADRLGIKKPETKAKLGATSREPKKEGQTWGSLVNGWEARTTLRERHAINETVVESMKGPLAREEANASVLDWSLRHLLERKSVITERELVTTALKHGLGNVTPEGIYEEMGKRRDLIRRDRDGRSLVTTQGVLSEEKRILEFAQKGRGRFRPLQSTARDGRVYVSEAVGGNDPTKARSDLANPTNHDPATTPPFGQAVSRAGSTPQAEPISSRNSTENPDSARTLSPSQLSAVRHAWYSRDPLILIRGAAGTGKTTMTKALLSGLDVPWVILAPSAEASRGVLRREGFHNAETLAKFLMDQETQESARNGLIVLDEASLAGAHDLSRLIQVADSLHSRVLLLGDRRQHKSVARGDVLALLEDRAGLPVATVHEVQRQKHDDYRKAAELMGKGDVVGGFARLNEMGWIKPSGLVDDYLNALKQGKGTLIVAPTHAEGNALTHEVRARLKAEGMLAKEEVALPTLRNLNYTKAELETARETKPENVILTRYGAYEPETRMLSVGDKIRFTANGQTLDKKHRLNNGSVYTVEGFTSSGNIKLNNGWIVDKNHKHWTHGYTNTTYASQGKGEQQVFVSMPTPTLGAVNGAAGYVAATRGKEKVTIYSNDKTALFEALERDDHRILASELVRAPRKGIKDRLKRRVAFLREMGSRVMGRGRIMQKGRELTHELG